MLRQWMTPNESATTTIPITLNIPDSPQAKAQLRAVLIDMTNAEKYLQEYGITPAAAAAEWDEALEDYEAAL